MEKYSDQCGDLGALYYSRYILVIKKSDLSGAGEISNIVFQQPFAFDEHYRLLFDPQKDIIAHDQQYSYIIDQNGNPCVTIDAEFTDLLKSIPNQDLHISIDKCVSFMRVKQPSVLEKSKFIRDFESAVDVLFRNGLLERKAVIK